MANLTTSTYAKRRINQSSFTSDESTLIDDLLAQVSKAIRRYCRREFDSQSFDELYDGNGQERLLLRQYPIISIARVAYAPTPVLEVINNSSSNQRASVAVTSTGLTLVRVASGTVTTDTSVTFSGNATIQALATAISALGSGWTARALSPYTLRDSDDLRAVQGAIGVKDRYGAIKMHVEELYDYEIDQNRGWLLRGTQDPDFDHNPAVFYGGINYWRVIYSAGYATVPEDIQGACAEWVTAEYWKSKDNPAAYPEMPPPSVVTVLEQYRKVGL